MLNPLRIFLIPTLLLFLLLTPSLVLAEYELRYNQSWRSSFYYSDRTEPSNNPQRDGSSSSILEGKRQSVAYVNYAWSKYIGFGFELGRLHVNDKSKTYLSGNYSVVDAETSVSHFTLNFHIPITQWFSIDSMLGYGYFYTRAKITKYWNNGAVNKYQLEEDGEHAIHYAYQIRTYPYENWFVGFGQYLDQRILDKTNDRLGFSPYIWQIYSYMLTIGYRFGMPAKAPTYSPPSGKPNYNNPCQLFKSC